MGEKGLGANGAIAPHDACRDVDTELPKGIPEARLVPVVGGGVFATDLVNLGLSTAGRDIQLLCQTGDEDLLLMHNIRGIVVQRLIYVEEDCTNVRWKGVDFHSDLGLHFDT